MRIAPALPVVLMLGACVADRAPGKTYAFAGTWDCAGAALRLTGDTYDDGTGASRILSVAQDGQSYTLTLANGTVIALAAVTDTGLTWVSGATGEQRTCLRSS